MCCLLLCCGWHKRRVSKRQDYIAVSWRKHCSIQDMASVGVVLITAVTTSSGIQARSTAFAIS